MRAPTTRNIAAAPRADERALASLPNSDREATSRRQRRPQHDVGVCSWERRVGEGSRRMMTTTNERTRGAKELKNSTAHGRLID